MGALKGNQTSSRGVGTFDSQQSHLALSSLHGCSDSSNGGYAAPISESSPVSLSRLGGCLQQHGSRQIGANIRSSKKIQNRSVESSLG